MGILRKVLCVIAIVMIAGASFAATATVDPTGAGGAYTTLKAALDNYIDGGDNWGVDAGDDVLTVVGSNGTVPSGGAGGSTGMLRPTAASGSLTIQGVDQPVIRMDPSVNEGFDTRGGVIVIDGLTFMPDPAAAYFEFFWIRAVGYGHGDALDMTVSNCLFTRAVDADTPDTDFGTRALRGM